MASTTDLVSRLKLETFDANDEVFKYGSYGDKFYFIITGKVEI